MMSGHEKNLLPNKQGNLFLSSGVENEVSYSVVCVKADEL